MRDRPPLTLDQLKSIAAGHRRNPDVIALLWEIRRLQDVLRRVDDDRQIIDRAWKSAGLGQLAALHQLRLLLRDEISHLAER